MKLSIALSLFVANSALSGISAFQSVARATEVTSKASSRRVAYLNAIAIDPAIIPVAPKQTEDESGHQIEMTGIALSVSRWYCHLFNGIIPAGSFSQARTILINLYS